MSSIEPHPRQPSSLSSFVRATACPRADLLRREARFICMSKQMNERAKPNMECFTWFHIFALSLPDVAELLLNCNQLEGKFFSLLLTTDYSFIYN